MSERGNLLLRILDRFIGIPLVAALGITRSKPPPDIEYRVANSQRFGILCIGAIGDLILCSPLIKSIRAQVPNAAVTLFVSRANVGATRLLSDVSQVVVVPVNRPWRAVQQLRRSHLEVLIDCSQWPRISAFLSALSGAGITVGFQTPKQYRHFAYSIAVCHKADQHELKNFSALATSIGLTSFGLPRISRDRLEDSQTWNQRKQRLDIPERYIVFHPWPSGISSDLKCWPSQYWRETARWLASNGYVVCITGAKEDVFATRKLIAFVSNELLDLSGQLSLQEVANLMSEARCIVSVNTGILHLACALNVPVVALNGPTDPKRWGAWGYEAINLSPTVPPYAYLNLGFEYPRNAVNTMDSLYPSSVIEAMQSLFGKFTTHVKSDSIANLQASQEGG